MAELIRGYGVQTEQKELRAEEQMRQFLTFEVVRKKYAIDILEVNEILEFGDLTEVPMMPDFIRGVINLRGEVVPVIDLGARLKQGGIEMSKRSCIVLIQVATSSDRTQTIGMLVDTVNEIVELSQEQVQPAPRMGQSIDTRFIEGMGRIDDRWIILLAVNEILSNAQLSELEQLTQTDWAESSQQLQ